MTLDDLLNKTCLIGLTYFDTSKKPIKQIQHAGTVRHVDGENGISIGLCADNDGLVASDVEEKVFVLPPLMSPWFVAPKGEYKDQEGGVLIVDPDFFVTWDVYKTQDEKQGDHEWWEWVPRTTPPQVNG